MEYVPASHDSHLVSPPVLLYFPAEHFEHEPPLGPVNPALQLQAVKPKLAGTELESAGHSKHALLSVL